jgi:hypothetical protein
VDEALILLRIDENMRAEVCQPPGKKAVSAHGTGTYGDGSKPVRAGTKTSWVSQTEASSARLIAAFMEWLALSTSPATQNQVGDWERDVQ